MKIEFPPDMFIHIMAVDTKWLDNVADDGLYVLQAAVNNGDYNKRNQNKVTLRVNQTGTEPDALSHGGILVMANVKKQTIKRALMVGFHMLATNGALGPDDYLGLKDGKANQPEEGLGGNQSVD